MVHHHTGDCMFVSSSMKLFPTDGLEGMGQFHGHHVHQTSLPWDFFLWGYLKDIVYKTKVWDIDDLKQRIPNAMTTIDEAMLQRTWQEIEYRLDVLRATNGAHIEVY